MVSHKISGCLTLIVMALVSVIYALSPGTRMLYESSGFLVDLSSDLKKCSKVQCVSGSNCSAEPDMKCSKFTYCGELVPNTTESSSLLDSSSVLLGDACLPAVALGKACINHTDCVDYWGGAYCSPVTHTCTRARVLNESCSADATCVFPLECEDGFCVNKFVFTVNETCDKSLLNGGCHLSLYCDNSTNICKELPVEGETCNSEVGCAAPFFCSPKKKKCLPAMSRLQYESCVVALDCAEGLVCARNNTCLEPEDNYTYTPKCKSNKDCPQTSYCHCDYVTGDTRCLPLPISENSTLDFFNVLVECVSFDPDYSLARCQDPLVFVQRSINASAILDLECSRLPPIEMGIDLILLLVPVTILIMILVLVVVVKLGIPKDK